MTAFDIFFTVVVGLSALFGLSRGLISEAVGLGAWIVALIVLRFLFSPASLWMRDSIGSNAGGDLAALVLIVVVTVVLVRFIGSMISGKVKESFLAPVDRGFGLVFGILRGLLLMAFVFLGMRMFIGLDNMPDWVREARTYPVVATSADAVSHFIGSIRRGDSAPAEAMLPAIRSAPSKTS